MGFLRNRAALQSNMLLERNFFLSCSSAWKSVVRLNERRWSRVQITQEGVAVDGSAPAQADPSPESVPHCKS